MTDNDQPQSEEAKEAYEQWLKDYQLGDPEIEETPEPHFLREDQGYGKCPECGSFLVNEGAQSDGDGDLYDALYCPNCQELMGKANERWINCVGNVFTSEEEYYELGDFDHCEDDQDTEPYIAWGGDEDDQEQNS